MRLIQSKFTKQTRKFFQKGGGAPGAPVLDPPLIIFMYSCNLKTPLAFHTKLFKTKVEWLMSTDW